MNSDQEGSPEGWIGRKRSPRECRSAGGGPDGGGSCGGDNGGPLPMIGGGGFGSVMGNDSSDRWFGLRKVVAGREKDFGY